MKFKSTEQLIAEGREELREEQRRKILDSMTPACRAKLDYFENWLRMEVKHVLQSRYELGLVALELVEDEKKNGGKLYGKNAIGRIGKVLRWDDGLIRLALRFVRAFSREQVEQLCTLVLPNGDPLTWSHVRCLLGVKEREQRKELLERTVQEGWSCTQLAEQIVEGQPRPVRPPINFDSAIKKQLTSAEQWDRQHTKVWSRPDTSLVSQAARLPADGVTQERLQKAQELAYQLRLVADQAVKQAEAAEQVVHDFEQILKEREEATGSANLMKGAAKAS